MKVILQDNTKLITLDLTKDVTGNYWLRDSKKNNLVNIEGIDNKWILKSNIDIKIIKDINNKTNDLLTNVNQIDSVELNIFQNFYLIDINTKQIYKIFVLPTYDNTMIQLTVDFINHKNIIIGNDKSATINCSNPLFEKKQIEIKFENNILYIVNNNPKLSMYINNILEKEKSLINGDLVFIDGVIFTFVGNILIINNPNNTIFYDSMKLTKRALPNNPIKDYTTETETFIEAFNKNEYFQRPPRFKRMIEEKEYNIDAPTSNNTNNDEMPLIYTMGPMMLMAVTSIMSSFTAVSNVLSGKSTFRENMTPIVATIAMLGSMVVFPFLQRMYTKNSKIKKERKRRKKYKKYIEKKKQEILQEIAIQKQILIENNVDLNTIAKIILNKERTLWDRKIEHPDFLNIRLGIGSIKPKIKVNYPEEHFTMDEDDLNDVYKELFETIKDIENIPVTINLVEKNMTGIVGDYFLNKTKEIKK